MAGGSAGASLDIRLKQSEKKERLSFNSGAPALNEAK